MARSSSSWTSNLSAACAASSVLRACRDHPLLVAAANLARIGKSVEGGAGSFLSGPILTFRRRKLRAGGRDDGFSALDLHGQGFAPHPKHLRVVRHGGDLGIQRCEPLPKLRHPLLGALDARSPPGPLARNVGNSAKP
jgi:hypothetical protein